MRADSDMLTCVSSPRLRAACSQPGAQGGNNGAAGEVAAFIATQAGGRAGGTDCRRQAAGPRPTDTHPAGLALTLIVCEDLSCFWRVGGAATCGVKIEM